jgi:hypothetical protein
MISNRRGVTRAAGLAVVAVLAVLALVLVIYKFKNEKAGPGVSAVPLGGTDGKGAATKPINAPAPQGKLAARPGLDRDMEIVVVDAVSKQPIAGAQLAIKFFVTGDPNIPDGVHNRREITEEKGRGWLMLPEKDPSYLDIQVKMDGYVSRGITYRDEPVPTSYKFELERGTSIGGVVHDEQGNPIAGVDVVCMLPGDSSAGRNRGDLWESAKGRSDEQGRWRCDGIEKDLKEVRIRVKHGDFVSELENDFTSKLPMEELRAMKGVIVMKKGLEVAGLVVDEAGKAIGNASVRVGEPYGNSMKVRADGDGRFVLKNSRPGSVTLTATARGYAPGVKAVKVGKEMGAVEFRLAKGNTIRGKIVDVNGKPVRGVMVALSPFHGLQWMTNSKADGTFEWTEAPAGELQFDMMKEGYVYVRQFRMSPSEKEYVITLRPPQKWHGSVVDAETGKPMESFLVVPGWQGENSPVFWDRSAASAKKGQNGQYEIEFTQPASARSLSIEVPGYLPAVSPPYKMDQSDVVFDVKLKKGTGPSGVVRSADGKPAAGVDVVLSTPTSSIQIRNGEFVLNRGGKAPTIKTGADGKFQLAPEIEPFVLLAMGDGGYAEVTSEQLKASQDVKLQPWGRVVGKLMKGSKPWPNEMVKLNYKWNYNPKNEQIHFEYEAKCDQEGNFVFERVVPKEMKVSRQMGLQKLGRYSAYTYSHPEKIDVRPGETVNVQVGGKGRPLIGKVNVPNDPVSRGWNVSGTLQTKQARPQLPEGYDEWTREQIQEWQKKYQESEQWKALNASGKYYAFAIEDDGSFRVEDAAPGVYEIQIRATDPATENRRTLAMTRMDVTMGEIPGGQSDEPLNVGTMEFQTPVKIKVGVDLSKVILKTIEGPPVKLADLKGKAVMIYFWSSRNKTVLAELPVLKEIDEQYGKDARLVVIGVCTNSRLVTGKAFAQSNGMKWMQAYVGINSTAYEDLGEPEYPAHLLIGADGKLINNVTRIETLKEEVGKVVKN